MNYYNETTFSGHNVAGSTGTHSSWRRGQLSSRMWERRGYPRTYWQPCVNSADLKRQRTGSWERNVAGELPSLACCPHVKGDTDVWAEALLVKQENVLQFLAAAATIGGTNLDFRLEKYM